MLFNANQSLWVSVVQPPIVNYSWSMGGSGIFLNGTGSMIHKFNLNMILLEYTVILTVTDAMMHRHRYLYHYSASKSNNKFHLSN